MVTLTVHVLLHNPMRKNEYDTFYGQLCPTLKPRAGIPGRWTRGQITAALQQHRLYPIQILCTGKYEHINRDSRRTPLSILLRICFFPLFRGHTKNETATQVNRDLEAGLSSVTLFYLSNPFSSLSWTRIIFSLELNYLGSLCSG